jgi:hypothetical protein
MKNLQYYKQKIITLIRKTIEGDFSLLLDYSLSLCIFLSAYMAISAPLRFLPTGEQMKMIRILKDIGNGCNDVWEFNNMAFVYVYFLMMTWICFLNVKLKNNYGITPQFSEPKIIVYWIVPVAHFFLSLKTIYQAKKDTAMITNQNQREIKIPGYYTLGWCLFWTAYIISLSASGFYEKHIKYSLIGLAGLLFSIAFFLIRKMVADIENYNPNFNLK